MAEESVGAIIGRNVRALRERGLYTRRELAARTNISHQTIAHLEQGTSDRPRRRTIEALAGALGVDVETLLAGVPTTPRQEAAPVPLDAEPRQRSEHPLVIDSRVEVDEAGDERLRMVVLWNVPEEERGYYRASLRLNGMTDYIEEELTPQRAAEMLAGVR